MPKRNRKTLKESFKQGKKPSEQDFENLIDSTINILDDGLAKQADTGIGLAPLQGNDTVMSIYRESGDDKAAWEMAIDDKTGDFQIRRFGETHKMPFLTLKNNGDILLGNEAGNIHFENQLNIPARKGSFLQGGVPANGRWHNITDGLEGCWALEVVAGCGLRNTGKHALLVAIATHCFGKKRKIKKVQSYYGGLGNKIRIRWVQSGFSCHLQVKTTYDYGNDTKINFHISKLWDNPLNEKIEVRS